MTRVAVVTGGTRGIGLAITERLHAKGYIVAANYAGNDEAARLCSDKFSGVRCYKWDVGDYDSSAEHMAQIERDLGPVDVLVNNAGITRDSTFHRMKPDQWRDVMRVNLDSMFNAVRPVIEGMRSRGFGRIVNISSINGQKGQIGQVNYSTAKAGVIGFTRALSLENAAKGVTVNCVAPGYVDTDMVSAVPEDVLAKIVAAIPVGRLGLASEVARCVCYLADDDAGFITGATFNINGGQYLA